MPATQVISTYESVDCSTLRNMRTHLCTESATLPRIGATLRRFESADGTGVAGVD